MSRAGQARPRSATGEYDHQPMAARELTRLQRVTYRVWLGVGVLLLLAAGLFVLGRPLAVLVPPVLIGTLLVYILNPIVSGLARLHIPRLAGTLIAFALFFGVLTGLISLLVPPLTQQLSMFAEVAPELGDELAAQINAWLAALGLDFEVGGQLDVEAAAAQAQDFLADAETRNAVLAVLGGLSGLAAGFVTFVLAFVVGPFVAAYMLWDLPRMSVWAHRAVPPQHREEVVEVARRLSQVVGGFIRGQLIVATYVGVGTSIALSLIGLPFWLVLGVIAGVTNLVPFIGPFIAGALGVAVALMTDGVGQAVLVVIVMTIVQQGDNQIVSPLVMGRTVRLHPLVVLLALLVAGTLYGIPGLLLAVPAVAAVNVLLAHFWRTRVPWAGEDDDLLARGRKGRRARRRAVRERGSLTAPPSDRSRAPVRDGGSQTGDEAGATAAGSPGDRAGNAG